MDRQRAAYLDALGIERWRLRVGGPAVAGVSELPDSTALTAAAVQRTGAGPGVAVQGPVVESSESQNRAIGRPSGGNRVLVGAAAEDSVVPLSEAPAARPRGPQPHPPLVVEGMDWSELEAAVAACTRCGLACGRSRTVFGTGDRKATWMVIGEAPGAEEDRRGEPFVGRAGQLLNAMLAAVGLAREQVYIANILKCRPPDNRDPTPEESASCWPYLQRQIALLAPRLILCVGRVAAQSLLGNTTPLGRLRGQPWRFGASGIPLVVTYHPAYLLRSPAEKRKAWEDLLLARELAAEAGA